MISISRTPIQKKVGQADKIVNFFLGLRHCLTNNPPFKKLPLGTSWHLQCRLIGAKYASAPALGDLTRNCQEFAENFGTFADAAEGEL